MTGPRRTIEPGSLPVEPLSDVTWQRIERRLFADGAIPSPDEADGADDPVAPPRRVGSRRWAWGTAVALATAAAVLVVVLGGRESDDRDPPAAIAAGDAPGHVGHGRAPSRIATADTPSAVGFGDVSLEVSPRSAILVDDDRERGVLIVLERGEVRCRVAPRARRSPVVVLAGDVRIEVVGTVFAVARGGDSARVVVDEGVVTVVEHGRQVRVGPGQRWASASASDSTTSQASASPAGTGGPGRSRTPGQVPARRRERAARQPVEPSGERDQALYEEAARMEASRPGPALAIYSELARGKGDWAANALYAAARLEVELGDRAAARRRLASYLRRFPTGPNAADARRLLEQIERPR